MYTKKLSIETLYENFKEYLPVKQQPYADSKAYIALCDALMAYLISDYDTKDEKKLVLGHAKEIFEHYCLTETDPTLYTWSNDLQKAIQ